MEQKPIQEAPATFSEAWQRGTKIGLELTEAKKEMRVMIAHRLQSCRMAERLTQQEVAMQIGINHLTYRGYENCKSDIPIVYLVRLADRFGVTMDYLTGRTDDKQANALSQTNPVEGSTDARIAQLEKMVAQLIDAQGNR